MVGAGLVKEGGGNVICKSLPIGLWGLLIFLFMSFFVGVGVVVVTGVRTACTRRARVALARPPLQLEEALLQNITNKM